MVTDETALFFIKLPSKKLNLANEICSGGTFSKERETAQMTVFEDGSILEPLVIGKAARSSCFKNLNINNMGIGYHSKKKA